MRFERTTIWPFTSSLKCMIMSFIIDMGEHDDARIDLE